MATTKRARRATLEERVTRLEDMIHDRIARLEELVIAIVEQINSASLGKRKEL